MNRIKLIIAIFVMTACQPIINNDIETLDKVFKMTNFEIEIINSGCFQYSKELFNISKTDNAYLIESKRTGKSNILSKMKIDSLKDHLSTRIGEMNNGGCTSGEYIRIGTFFNSVDYDHNYCSGLEARMINNLLNYYELISEEVEDE